MIHDLTRDDVADILYGATLFGAGGGGDLQEGFDLIDLAMDAGKRFRMMALDHVPDDALVCTPYLLGAVADLPQGDDTLVEGKHPIQLAFDTMMAHLQQPIHGTVACEMGGSNTAVPFFVAAMNDAVVIDADPAGRAVPEITHSSYAIAGLAPGPIYVANAMGETMVLNNVRTDQRAEDVVRALARISGDDIAAIDHVLPARTLRSAILPGTLSRAWRLGKLWRAARSDPETLAHRIAKAADGAVLFEGQVSACDLRNENGFTVGTFNVEGHGSFAGQSFRVDVKNENMVGWLNGEPVVTIPEIITALDMATGDAITNANIHASQKVAILVLPAPDIFLTSAGLQVFGPQYAGLKGGFKSALAGGP